ncbi:MAG: glycoside hydrolase family 2 TIM barrel-domain containing protein [Eubacteriales bacterium]|nr:glycoside hydrolase family 2 TIM barrel-domain containing protein [Eubacteriales bacterium]
MNTVSTHPNPQLERENWVSLNGKWDFGFKKAKPFFNLSDNEKDIMNFYHNAKFTHEINVPYCIESVLSGIGYTDFVNAVWYRKTVEISNTDGCVFLHIGAADYLTSVIINGKLAGSHKGGYTSFSFDISPYIKQGENEIFILCQDDTKSPLIPSGKQSNRKNSYACSYTRTTGIWQTVYLEYTPKEHINSFEIYPNPDQKEVTISFSLTGRENLSCTVFYDGKAVGCNAIENAFGNVILHIPLDEIHLWEVGHGRLYDLEITFGGDKVKSYFGLRSVGLENYKFLINGKSVFQRLVLDQGYYRKGIYTAQNDEELIRDIRLSIDLGFNGARLHQKVFDPRFLYFCDRAGYMVWGEYANWGIDYSSYKLTEIFLAEWKEAVERDFNHPSIIGWCPFNETWNYHGRRQNDNLISTVYDFTKAVDTTRPCIDTSGNFHTKTDIYDVHDYRFKPDEFKKDYDKLVTDGTLYEHVLIDNPGRQHYNGEPVFISEYGGIKWETDKEYKSWGYGDDVKSEEEFAERYCGLTDAITKNERILGFCYTQLYDVEQEQNGLYTYDRKPKFSAETYDKIRKSNVAVAAIEK